MLQGDAGVTDAEMQMMGSDPQLWPFIPGTLGVCAPDSKNTAGEVVLGCGARATVHWHRRYRLEKY